MPRLLKYIPTSTQLAPDIGAPPHHRKHCATSYIGIVNYIGLAIYFLTSIGRPCFLFPPRATLALKLNTESPNKIVTITTVHGMVDEADKDNDGTIDFPGTADLVHNRRSRMKAYVMCRILFLDGPEDEGRRRRGRNQRGFKIFDRDNKGFFSAAELRKAMSSLEAKLTDDEVVEMIREADQGIDASGQPIDYDSFVRPMMASPPRKEPAWDGEAYLRDMEVLLYRAYIASLGELEGWTDRRINELQHMLKPFKFGDQVEHLGILAQVERERTKPPRFEADVEIAQPSALFLESTKEIGSQLVKETVPCESWCPSTVQFLLDTFGVAGLHSAKL